MPQGMAYGITACYGLFAVLGFLTAVGLFRMRGCSKDIAEHHIEKTMGQPAGTSAHFSEAALRFFSVLGAGVMIIVIYFLVTCGDAFRQGEPDEVAVA